MKSDKWMCYAYFLSCLALGNGNRNANKQNIYREEYFCDDGKHAVLNYQKTSAINFSSASVNKCCLYSTCMHVYSM